MSRNNLKSFRPPDHPYTSVFPEQKLCRSEFSVIIISHGEPVGSCIMNKQIVTHINLRQHSVNGEFVIIFTEGAGYVIFMIAGCILFSQHSNVMICAVHGGRMRFTAQASTPIYSLYVCFSWIALVTSPPYGPAYTVRARYRSQHLPFLPEQGLLHTLYAHLPQWHKYHSVPDPVCKECRCRRTS